MNHGIPREDLKIAVHDYKVFPNSGENMPFQPDYYCRKHVVNSPEEDVWIHYKSHELVGLSKEEFENYYSFTDKDFIEILNKELFDEKE
jgi:hypothetical protein